MTAVSGTPFTISGTGIADLMLNANNAPVLLGSPLLVSGVEGTSKALTYRYFLKDKNTANTLELFQAGGITITFNAGGFSTAQATNRKLVQTFTVSPAAPGGASTTAPLKVGANGPLELLGPSISLADVGFDEGKLVLSIAIGVDRAKLVFGSSDSFSAELVGILGTFDVMVDAFGLLSGNVDIGLSQKFSLRVAGLEVHVKDVVDVTAGGIVVQYDPKGPANQELVRIDSVSVTFPKFDVRGTIAPLTTPTGTIPGLVVRSNGFTIGTAELRFGGTNPSLQSTSGEPQKIAFGSILEFDDLRVGVQNFGVTFGPAVTFGGSIFVASGGVTFLPGKPISARSATADRRRPTTRTASPNTEAVRATLDFDATAASRPSSSRPTR